MTIAIVTDSLSADFYFPVWYKYYASQFGAKNIFLFTYPGQEEEFSKFDLGGVEILPQSYDDDLRRDIITAFVDKLLSSFEAVLRIDVDEFLVVRPGNSQSLFEYLSTNKEPHISARGFDVIQWSDEAPLNLDRPILEQRRIAYALDAMNKTCFTRVPIKWGRGFHYCSVPPIFGDIFLLHCKRADTQLQNDWNRKMENFDDRGGFLRKYYSWQSKEITDYQKKRMSLPVVSDDLAMERVDFWQRFGENIRLNKAGIYEGRYEIEEVNVEIHPSIRHAF